MSAWSVALLVFACVFGAALFGIFLRGVLPEHHLDEGSVRAISLATGLVATLAALVLGLLTASGKATFEKVNDEFTQIAANAVLLDRVLANYGPESGAARAQLKNGYRISVDLIFDAGGDRAADLDSAARLAGMEQFNALLRELSPKGDSQRILHERALKLADRLAQERSLAIAYGENAIPMPFLVVLVLWLTLVFTGFGLISARNATVTATLLVAALSVAGTVFLIEEMARPFDGLLKVSEATQRNALAHMGR